MGAVLDDIFIVRFFWCVVESFNDDGTLTVRRSFVMEVLGTQQFLGIGLDRIDWSLSSWEIDRFFSTEIFFLGS